MFQSGSNHWFPVSMEGECYYYMKVQNLEYNLFKKVNQHGKNIKYIFANCLIK
jgi:hypothetical protein